MVLSPWNFWSWILFFIFANKWWLSVQFTNALPICLQHLLGVQGQFTWSRPASGWGPCWLMPERPTQRSNWPICVMTSTSRNQVQVLSVPRKFLSFLLLKYNFLQVFYGLVVHFHWIFGIQYTCWGKFVLILHCLFFNINSFILFYIQYPCILYYFTFPSDRGLIINFLHTC